MIKLPEAEYEIMNVIWENKPAEYSSGISTTEIISHLDPSIKWKPQTVLTLLVRLTERKFISSEKHGKERYYKPLVEKADYLKFETDNFIEKYYKNSITGLVSAFCNDNKLTDSELDELRKLLDKGGKS